LISLILSSVDHNILLLRLETSFGIGGSVLAWLKSFLSVPKQTVCFNGVTSACHSVVCGVPLGSVLGRLLFLLYTADVALIAQRHRVAVHSYADDTQLYGRCQAPDGSTSASLLLCCVADIAEWMTSNSLQLNAEKTQFICVTTQLQSAVCRCLLAASLCFQTTLRNLDVTFDTLLTMRHMVCSCFF